MLHRQDTVKAISVGIVNSLIFLIAVHYFKNADTLRCMFSTASLLICCWLSFRKQSEMFISTSLSVSAVLMIVNFALLLIIKTAVHCYYFGGLDIAWYSQATWKIANGYPPIVTIVLPIHHISNHFEFIMYPLGWIYSLFKSSIPSYLFLYVSQLAANSILGATLIVSLLKDRSRPLARSFAITTVVAVTHWGFIGANQFEFHPPTLGLTLFLISLGLFSLGMTRTAALLAFCTIGCGEMFAIIGTTVSALFLAENIHNRKRKAICLFVGFSSGTAILFSYFKWIKPAFAVTGESSDFVAERYSTLGATVVDIILSPLLKTKIFFDLVLNSEKNSYFLYLFLPLLLITLLYLVLGWRNRFFKLEDTALFSLAAGTLIIIAPMAKIALSNYPSYIRTDVHYAADVLPGMLLCLFGLSISVAKRNIMFAAGAILLSVSISLSHASISSPLFFINESGENSIISEKSRAYIREIDPSISVFTDNDVFSPELSSRKDFRSIQADFFMARLKHYPQTLILSWAPEHFNRGIVDNKSFRKSFKMVGPSTFETSFLGANAVYKQVEIFDLNKWTISVWNKVLVR